MHSVYLSFKQLLLDLATADHCPPDALPDAILPKLATTLTCGFLFELLSVMTVPSTGSRRLPHCTTQGLLEDL